MQTVFTLLINNQPPQYPTTFKALKAVFFTIVCLMIATKKLVGNDGNAYVKVAETYNKSMEVYNLYVKECTELTELQKIYLQKFIEPLVVTIKI